MSGLFLATNNYSRGLDGALSSTGATRNKKGRKLILRGRVFYVNETKSRVHVSSKLLLMHKTAVSLDINYPEYLNASGQHFMSKRVAYLIL